MTTLHSSSSRARLLLTSSINTILHAFKKAPTCMFPNIGGRMPCIPLHLRQGARDDKRRWLDALAGSAGVVYRSMYTYS